MPPLCADPSTYDPFSDATSIQPVSDEVFAAYASQFEYRRGDLNATQPVTMATTDDWIKQRVTIDTGYGGERMDVILFIPTRFEPPFQPVIYHLRCRALWCPGDDRQPRGFGSRPFRSISSSNPVGSSCTPSSGNLLALDCPLGPGRQRSQRARMDRAAFGPRPNHRLLGNPSGHGYVTYRLHRYESRRFVCAPACGAGVATESGGFAVGRIPRPNPPAEHRSASITHRGSRFRF